MKRSCKDALGKGAGPGEEGEGVHRQDKKKARDFLKKADETRKHISVL